TPALLQTMCTLPKASYASFAARSRLVRSLTSQTTLRSCERKLCRPCTAAVSASLSMSTSTTFMPPSAKAPPTASPMPLAPPVTNAVLPASSRMSVSQGLEHWLDRTFPFACKATKQDLGRRLATLDDVAERIEEMALVLAGIIIEPVSPLQPAPSERDH